MTHALDDGMHRQLKDTVYLQLRDDIVNGTLPPGAVLREAELATRFGVSKTPLRDALVRLQKDGFVEIPPYRSAVVVGYSRTDLREIYELRDELAGLLDQFDLVMYAQSRNSRIDEMAGNIRGHIQRIGRLTTGIPGRLAKSVPEHLQIYEAIVQRDGAAAEALMRRHILSVMADQLTEVTDTP